MSLSRAQLLTAARVKAMRDAAVAGVATLFADIEVKSHPGKLDMSDVLKKGVFTAPSIHIAASRIMPDGRLSASDDFTLEMTAYVVAEDVMVSGARVERDEMALAICEALLTALSDDDFARWGLQDIGCAEEPKAAPLFTIKSFTEGAVYWAVTWKQTLYSVSTPIFGRRYEEELDI